MKKTSQLKRILGDEGLEAFEKSVIGDRIIIPTLEKIIKDISLELQKPTSLSDFGRASWALEKAYREGGVYYLQQVLNIFKEKQ